MPNFFDLFRQTKDRRASKFEMEGFDPQPPEPPKTEYALDQPILMPDMPELAQRRTKLGDELEGADRGVPLTTDLEPGTDISAERTEQLNREAAAQRQAKLVRRVGEMKEMALKRALQMTPDAMEDYLAGLEMQAQDTEERAAGLLEEGQTELAEVENDEVKVLRAQAEAVRELLEIRKQAM